MLAACMYSTVYARLLVLPSCVHGYMLSLVFNPVLILMGSTAVSICLFSMIAVAAIVVTAVQLEEQNVVAAFSPGHCFGMVELGCIALHLHVKS